MKPLRYILFLSLLQSVFITNSCHIMFSCDDWVDENFKLKKFDGIILNKVKTTDCHGKFTFTSNDKIDSIEICYCTPFQDCWYKTSEGDSILKDIGSTKVKIKHNGEITTWDRFPCCDW